MKTLFRILICILVCICMVSPVMGKEKKKIVIWEWISTQGPGAVYQEILQSYRDSHPDVEVESISTPWNQAHDKVLLMQQADQVPDIIGVNRNWLVEFTALDIIEDLTPYVTKIPGMREN